MLVLALDTATPTFVAGIARWTPETGPEVLAERAVPSGNRHAELLTATQRNAAARRLVDFEIDAQSRAWTALIATPALPGWRKVRDAKCAAAKPLAG